MVWLVEVSLERVMVLRLDVGPVDFEVTDLSLDDLQRSQGRDTTYIIYLFLSREDGLFVVPYRKGACHP